MNDKETTTELLAIRQTVYNWYIDYAEFGISQDYSELLDMMFYPYIWKLFYKHQITAYQLVELGGYAEELGAALRMGVKIMFEPGKINIPLENQIMGITGRIILDPKIIPEYLELCDEGKEQLINNIFLAISGALGWRLFTKRFEKELERTCDG